MNTFFQGGFQIYDRQADAITRRLESAQRNKGGLLTREEHRNTVIEALQSLQADGLRTNDPEDRTRNLPGQLFYAGRLAAVINARIAPMRKELFGHPEPLRNQRAALRWLRRQRGRRRNPRNANALFRDVDQALKRASNSLENVLARTPPWVDLGIRCNLSTLEFAGQIFPAVNDRMKILCRSALEISESTGWPYKVAVAFILTGSIPMRRHPDITFQTTSRNGWDYAMARIGPWEVSPAGIVRIQNEIKMWEKVFKRADLSRDDLRLLDILQHDPPPSQPVSGAAGRKTYRRGMAAYWRRKRDEWKKAYGQEISEEALRIRETRLRRKKL